MSVQPGQITSTDLSPNAGIQGNQIADGTIQTRNFAPGAILAAHIADQTLTGTQIQNGSVFKIVQTGTITLTNSGTNPTNITIPHNLGTNPAFLVYTQIPAGWTGTPFAGQYIQTPMVVPTNTGTTAAIISPSVDNTNLYISERDIYSSGGAPNTFNIKYYLLQETAN